MPFPMKIQPIYSDDQQLPLRAEHPKPVLKSRLKRLFDRQFRVSSTDKLGGCDSTQYGKDGGAATHEFESSSLCLAKMVQNYIEESNEKQLRGRNRCNCFNGNGNESSDDEFDAFGESTNGGISSGDTCDFLKTLTPCASVAEKNLLADTAMIVEKNKNHKRKDDLRELVNDGLFCMGYNSSICKSKWEKSPCFPAGEYEYIDVIIEGEGRLLVDIDFRSEFEIARSTSSYKTMLQSLPNILVGKPDRIGQIVSIVSEAAKQSLKKKGMHIPPWRKTEYMRAKWLSSFTRATQNDTAIEIQDSSFTIKSQNDTGFLEETKVEMKEEEEESEGGDLELIFGEVIECEETPAAKESSPVRILSYSPMWMPPAVELKSCDKSARVVVTGLASLLKEKS